MKEKLDKQNYTIESKILNFYQSVDKNRKSPSHPFFSVILVKTTFMKIPA